MENLDFLTTYNSFYILIKLYIKCPLKLMFSWPLLPPWYSTQCSISEIMFIKHAPYLISNQYQIIHYIGLLI